MTDTPRPAASPKSAARSAATTTRARVAGGRFASSKTVVAGNAKSAKAATSAKPAAVKKPTSAKAPAAAGKAAPGKAAATRQAAATATKPTVTEEPAMTNGAPASAEPVELYLLRHADAGDPMTWAGDDAERPLSSKGRRQAKRLGRLLAGIKLRPDVILTSPKIRAADTAKIVGKAVSVKPQKDDRLGTSVELGDLAGLLAGNKAARRVVLVGHDPDFSTLASSLTGAAIELKKGAIARIDLADGGPRAGGGALRWLVPPGVLTD